MLFRINTRRVCPLAWQVRNSLNDVQYSNFLALENACQARMNAFPSIEQVIKVVTIIDRLKSYVIQLSLSFHLTLAVGRRCHLSMRAEFLGETSYV